MRQETRTRKKYAAGRAPQATARPIDETTEPAEMLERIQAVADQVARLQRAAKRMARRPRVLTIPTQATDTMTPEEWVADQERRKVILAGLIAKAQALVPDAPDSPTRRACRESPLDEIIVEKFRRQGFNL